MKNLSFRNYLYTIVFITMFLMILQISAGFSSSSKKNSTPPASSSSAASASPSPKTKSLDPKDYKIMIEMEPNNPYMFVNGVRMEIDPNRGTSPIIQKGRTLIPISAIVTVLGGDTSWDSKTKSIIVDIGENELLFALNSFNMVVNGKAKKIDVAPKLINSRTLVPIRFLVENCNVDIEWKNNKILIGANYLPGGVGKIKSVFENILYIENMSNTPNIFSLLSDIY